MFSIAFINQEHLIVSFADESVNIFVDEAIYPNSQKTKKILIQIDFSDTSKQMKNTIVAKQLVWQLLEILQYHLNQLPSRNPDYTLLEQEYKNIQKAYIFICYGIQYLHQKEYEFSTAFENPMIK